MQFSSIDQTARLRVRVLGRNQLLTAVTEQVLVPLDGFEKTLQRSDREMLLQRQRFDVLSLDVAEQPADVDCEQPPAGRSAKALGKQTPKLGAQFSQRRDILKRQATTLRGFRAKL